MLMFIIGMSLPYSCGMSSLHISQAARQTVAAWHLSQWLLLATILGMVIVQGIFLPSPSIILMTATDIPLKDVIWGVMPFLGLMFVAILRKCCCPGIAAGWPAAVMGAPK